MERVSDYVRCGVMLAACGYKIDEAHETKRKNISGIYVKFLVFNIYGSWWCMCRSAPQTYYSRSSAYENVPARFVRSACGGLFVSDAYKGRDIANARYIYSKWYRMNSLDVSGRSLGSNSTVIYTPEICILYECNFLLQGGWFISVMHGLQSKMTITSLDY